MSPVPSQTHASHSSIMREHLKLLTLLFGTMACAGGGDGGTPPPPVQVAAAVAVSISSADALVSLGETRTLTAVVRDSANAVITNATVHWTSSAPSVILVSPATGLSTTATSVGNGSATITATSGTANSAISTSVAQRLSSVVLSPPAFSVKVGENQQLTSSARDARGNVIAGVTGFEYSSNNTGVATVSPSGTVSGAAAGSAIITSALTLNAVSASGTSTATVTFTAPVSATVTTSNSSFNPSSVEITVGGSVTWNFGSTAHNVNFSSAGAPANIPTTSGASVSRTFGTAGTFPYACNLHEGMTGTVIVQ